jgi:hypothetical protein
LALFWLLAFGVSASAGEWVLPAAALALASAVTLPVAQMAIWRDWDDNPLRVVNGITLVLALCSLPYSLMNLLFG